MFSDILGFNGFNGFNGVSPHYTHTNYYICFKIPFVLHK